MDAEIKATNIRLAAYTALGGAIIMFIGSALWGASGADLDSALSSGEISSYLTRAGESRYLLVANLSFWIIGALLLGIAGNALANLCDRRRAATQIALVGYWTAVPLAIVAFVAWLAIVVQLAPDTSATAALLAEVIGWFASRVDWIATILLVGLGPALISLAGRDDWVPNWLYGWGIATAVAALLTVVAMFTGALATYGFLIVPVGLGWMIAAGIVLLRRIGETERSEHNSVSSQVSKESA